MTVNGKKVSRLALGTAGFGGRVSEDTSFELIDTYISLGGNLMDTARVYGNSEETLGKYLKSRGGREELIIATKGAHYDTATKAKRVSARDIEYDIETSLKMLKTDYVDLYWLHRDDEDIPVGEIVEMTAPLVKSGKATALGVSNWKPERIKDANDYAREHGLPEFVTSQIKHCAAVTVSENDPTILSLNDTSREFYKQEAMPIFAFTSQARGFFSKLEGLGVEGVSEWIKREFLCDENLRRFDVMKSLAAKYECPVSHIALAALLCDEELEIIPIIGGKTSEQIKDSFAAMNIKLSPEEISQITKG